MKENLYRDDILNKVLFYLMGRDAFDDIDNRYRNRFYTNTVLLTSLMMHLYLIVSYFYIVNTLPFVIGAICTFLHLVSPAFYRLFKSYNFCVSIMLFFGTVWITTFSYFNGGIESSVLLWMALIPILAGVLSGKKLLLLFFGLVLLISISYAGQIFSDSIPYNYISDEGVLVVKVIHLFGFLLLSIFLSYSFGIKESLRTTEFENESQYSESLYQVLIHDIKGPLFIIKNMINKISKNYDDQSHISKARKATYLIEELVQSISTSYFYKHNINDISVIEYSLLSLLDDSLDIYREKLKLKSLEVTKSSSLKHVRILCDQKIFKRQVLQSIISNSLKFSYENSQVEIFLKKGSRYCDLCIRDNGVGVPHQLHKSVFTGGRSISTTGTYGETGTGYGLYIAKETMIELGGDIFLNSFDDESPEGTVVTIRLPNSIISYK